MHDVPYFDRFAPLYDLFIPGTDDAPIVSGLAMAERPLDCLVDLGGGTGRAASVITQPTAVLDGSQPMLAKARERDLPTIRGDVRSLPLGSGQVDGLVAVDALHHFPEVPSVLEEAARVLRPGGVFVIRDFDPTTLRGRGLVLGERVIGFESTFFAPSDLTSLLRDVGLKPTVLNAGFAYTVVGVKES